MPAAPHEVRPLKLMLQETVGWVAAQVKEGDEEAGSSLGRRLAQRSRSDRTGTPRSTLGHVTMALLMRPARPIASQFRYKLPQNAISLFSSEDAFSICWNSAVLPMTRAASRNSLRAGVCRLACRVRHC